MACCRSDDLFWSRRLQCPVTQGFGNALITAFMLMLQEDRRLSFVTLAQRVAVDGLFHILAVLQVENFGKAGFAGW